MFDTLFASRLFSRPCATPEVSADEKEEKELAEANGKLQKQLAEAQGKEKTLEQEKVQLTTEDNESAAWVCTVQGLMADPAALAYLIVPSVCLSGE